jgi:hypothetical protein
LDLNGDFRAVGLIGHFVEPFSTKKILKFGSNEDE